MKKIIILLIIILLLVLIFLGFYFRGYLIYITTGKVTKSLCNPRVADMVFGISRKSDLKYPIFNISRVRDKMVQGHSNLMQIAYHDMEDAFLYNDLTNCITEAAYYSGNSKTCNQIANPTSKDGCFYKLAVTNNKVELCNNVSNQSVRDNCLYEIAVVYSRPDICSQIANQQYYKAKCEAGELPNI